MMSSFPPRLRRHLHSRKRLREDGDDRASQELWVCSLFPGAGDVTQAVQGKVELRAAADDGGTHLLVVAIPHELHPQHVGVAGPLRGGERGRKKIKDRVQHVAIRPAPRTRLRVR